MVRLYLCAIFCFFILMFVCIYVFLSRQKTQGHVNLASDAVLVNLKMTKADFHFYGFWVYCVFLCWQIPNDVFGQDLLICDIDIVQILWYE